MNTTLCDVASNQTIYSKQRNTEIFPLAKHDLVLGGITLVGKHRRQSFLVVGHQVYTHLRRDFGPLLFADPFQWEGMREGGSSPIFHVTWPHP